jgi:2-desacetyl-2-hydroxyethyl bacteriochlorophyllide A dehydrogenase
MRYVTVSPGAVELADGPAPPLPAGSVRVRVLACGICGTDVHMLHGMRLPRGVSYPVRPGHEVAGTVVETAAAGPAVGELVVLHPLAPCGSCAACAAGREQNCERALVLGISAPGGLAEEVVWPAARTVVATGLAPAAAAVLADAFATAYRALQVAAVPAGGALAVLGAGGVGTQLLRLARVLDPQVRLAAVVSSAASAQRVAALGVPVERGVAGVAKRLRPLGPFDAVADFSGSADAPAEGVRLLRPGGRLVLGAVLEEDLRLGPGVLVQTRELVVAGVYSSTLADLRAVAALALDGRLDVGASITHRIPMAAAATAFDTVAARPPGLERLVVEAG